MTASAILELCSEALVLLGDKALSDSADLSSPANNREKICQRALSGIRTVLSAHPWNGITTREALTEDTASAPSIEFTRYFSLPTDKIVLQLITVWLDDLIIEHNNYEDTTINYRIEGAGIITSASSVNIKFTYYPSNGSDDSAYNTYFAKLDEALNEAIAAALQARMAYAITRNATLAEAKKRDAQESLERAVLLNDRQNPKVRKATGRINRSRYLTGARGSIIGPR